MSVVKKNTIKFHINNIINHCTETEIGNDLWCSYYMTDVKWTIEEKGIWVSIKRRNIRPTTGSRVDRKNLVIRNPLRICCWHLLRPSANAWRSYQWIIWTLKTSYRSTNYIAMSKYNHHMVEEYLTTLYTQFLRKSMSNKFIFFSKKRWKW